ncbi:MAG: methylmalonyl-CoA mutase family protein, partial [Chitinophagaceae bacterium]
MNGEKKIFTDSGIEVKKIYTAEDIKSNSLELPGEIPFTRGVQPDMY